MTTQASVKEKAQPDTKGDSKTKEKTYSQAEVDVFLAAQKKTHDTQIKALTASYEETEKKDKKEIKRLKVFEESSELDEDQRGAIAQSLQLDDREAAIDKREVDTLVREYGVPEERRALIAALRSDMREQAAQAFGKQTSEKSSSAQSQGSQDITSTTGSRVGVALSDRGSGPGGGQAGSSDDKEFLEEYGDGKSDDHERAGKIFKAMGVR